MSLSTNITAIDQIATSAATGASVLQNNFELSSKIASLATNVSQGLSTVPASSISTVTQETSITTGVTINALAGVITTVTATTGAANKSVFTVTNSNVTASSVLSAVVHNYSGTYATNGFPNVTISNVTSGAFDIVISNYHASNALNGILKIGFAVLA